MEEWKVCVDFPTHEVSTLGNIRHIKRKINMIGMLDKDGYRCVCITKDKKNHCVRIHRQMAKAFLPNPNNHPLIDHIDINPLNNIISNLRWASYRMNQINQKFTGSIDVREKQANVRWSDGGKRKVKCFNIKDVEKAREYMRRLRHGGEFIPRDENGNVKYLTDEEWEALQIPI